MRAQRLQHIVDEIGCLVLIDRRIDAWLRRIGGVGLFLGDEVVLHHRAQHLELALLGGGKIDQRVVLRRRLRQPGEQARLRQVEVVGVGVEVAVRRRLDPIGLAAIEDGIEVHLEDLALRVAPIHLEG